jgi:vitamin B12 transporter
LPARGARATGEKIMRGTQTSAALLALGLTVIVAARADEVSVAPIIVTATRTAQTADDTLAPVTIITREDIERLQPHSLPELLSGLPGVSVASNGGLGTVSSVFLRGTESDQVLVLLDGVRIGSVTSGTTAFEQIPVDLIERIEIVRGPRSALYGSEAIGGVIQIFTRKGAPQLTPSFSIGGGSHDTVQGSAGVAGSVGQAWYTAGVSGLDTTGINACRGAGAPVYAGCFTNEPDQDGYRSTAGLLRGGYRFDGGAEVSGEWLRSYGDSQYDGSFQNESKLVQQLLGATVKLPLLPYWQSTLSGGQTEDDSTNFENGAYTGIFNTLRNSVSWQNDFTLAPGQQLSVGSDYLKDHLYSDTLYDVSSRENLGGFLQWLGRFGAHELQLAGRADHNQQFGGHGTGSAAYGYRFSRALRVIASYGTGYKAPSFNELYFPSFGNPRLRPEKSRSGELGLSGRAGIWSWALNAYQTNVSGLITYDASIMAPANVERARIRGVEYQLGAYWQQWRGQLYLDYLDARNRSEGNHLLPRRAPGHARLDLDRDLGRFSFGATLNAAQRRFDDLSNVTALGGYATVDLRAGWQFQRRWLLQAQISNLFDKDYETAAYYNQLGRSFFINLRYHPA